MRCTLGYYPECNKDCVFNKKCAEMKAHGYSYHIKACANCINANHSYEDIDCKLHHSWEIEQYGYCNDFRGIK